ncbi:MAG: class I SAM-dependent methyltransferase [Firmicutes bacterium]|nr:class I SAM-dependent methyltransferase [Bacillota bacterium]
MTDCKICGNSVDELQCRQLYWHCPVCDLITLDNNELLTPEAEKERYQLHNNVAENEGYVLMFERFLEFAAPWLPDGGQALDFGCGPGPVLARMLEQQGWEVTIYDPFFAPSRDFCQHSFELVTATEVFEHFVYPLAELRTLNAVLAPGGVLAVMTHFHSGPDAFCDWWYRRDPTHIVFYSIKTFLWLANELGLELKASDNKKSVVLQKPAQS